MQKLIVANWKMNPVHKEDAEALFRSVAGLSLPQNVEVVIAPPAIYLEPLRRILTAEFAIRETHLSLAAQDFFWKDEGAATGELSPVMLRDLGVKYAMVGHSEQRAMGEDDIAARRKTEAALRGGLAPLLCVGEPSEVRQLGFDEAKRFVLAQLAADLPDENVSAERLVVAYEPVWAISTSEAHEDETPEDASMMIEAIGDYLRARFRGEFRVLYGGSVKADNARAFFSSAGINGALVGHASLDAEEFKKIVAAAG